MGQYIYINNKPLTNSKQFDTYFFGVYKRLHKGEDLFKFAGDSKIISIDELKLITEILRRFVYRFNAYGNQSEESITTWGVASDDRELFKRYYKAIQPWWGPNCERECEIKSYKDFAREVTNITYLYNRLCMHLHKIGDAKGVEVSWR